MKLGGAGKYNSEIITTCSTFRSTSFTTTIGSMMLQLHVLLVVICIVSMIGVTTCTTTSSSNIIEKNDFTATTTIEELKKISNHMEELLLRGDTTLQEIVESDQEDSNSNSNSDLSTTINQYLYGIQLYTNSTIISSLLEALNRQQDKKTTKEGDKNNNNLQQVQQNTIEVMTTITTTLISLYTNLGTAYSMLIMVDNTTTTDDNQQQDQQQQHLQNLTIESYRRSIKVYQNFISIYNLDATSIDPSSQTMDSSYIPSELQKPLNDMKLIVAQTSFYLGMIFQDMEITSSFSIEAYVYAISLDPYHWSSYSNLGSIYHDQNRDYHNARIAYTIAYHLLVNPNIDITDPPQDHDQYNYILSQLQYRIGLCVSNDIVDDVPSSNDNTTTSKKKGNELCIVFNNSTTLNDNIINMTNHEMRDCKEMATNAFALAIQYDPDNVSAKHMLASLTADATIQRASNIYVKDLFDQYAKNFEHSLVKELQYTGYERLRRGFDRAMQHHFEYSDNTNDKNNNNLMFDVVVDAGCGTGLVGEQFRNISQTLIGIDLSEVIIEKAIQTRPKLYDQVMVGDITTILSTAPIQQTVSLIIAADSFIYFGDLEPLFISIHDGLVDDIHTTKTTFPTTANIDSHQGGGGYIAFTLENVNPENEIILNTSKPNWKWQLTASGRFAHRKDYVINIAKQYGFELIYYESMDGFRYEHRIEVRGHLFVMKKQQHKEEVEEMNSNIILNEL